MEATPPDSLCEPCLSYTPHTESWRPHPLTVCVSRVYPTLHTLIHGGHTPDSLCEPCLSYMDRQMQHKYNYTNLFFDLKMKFETGIIVVLLACLIGVILLRFMSSMLVLVLRSLVFRAAVTNLGSV